MVDFEVLRAHGEWADRRLLQALQASAGPVPEALRELGHIRGAQEVWLARIERRQPTLAVWPELTIDALDAAGAAVDAAWRAFLSGVSTTSLGEPVEYANSSGQAFITPLGDILLHLMSHGQYHRGKANAALRAAGVGAVGVDYILWQRARALGAGAS